MLAGFRKIAFEVIYMTALVNLVMVSMSNKFLILTRTGCSRTDACNQ